MLMPGSTLGKDKVLPNRAILIAALVFLTSIFVIAPIYISQDNYWVLYMAREVLSGAKAYVDFIEVNPPLIIWLNIPPAWFAEVFGVAQAIAFKAYVFGLIAMTLAFCVAFIRRIKPPSSSLLFVLLAAVLTIVPASQFGQREHLMLILCLPYFFQVAARAEQIDIPTHWIVITTFMAAIGFCIKPYFVFIPALCELFLLIKLGWATFKRFEPYLLGFLGLLYLGSIFVFTPEYLSDVVKYARVVYQAGIGTNADMMISILFPMIVTMIGGVIFCGLLRKRPEDIHALYIIFLIVIFATLCGFLLQFKGFPNHTYPTRAFGIVLIVVGVVAALKMKDVWIVIRYASLILLGPIYIFAYQHLQYSPRHSPQLEYFKALVDKYPGTETVFIMSVHIENGFPLINETNLKWGSRYPSLWMTPGIQKLRASGDTRPIIDKVETYSHRTVAEDLIKYKPDLVFVHVAEKKRFFEELDYSFIEDYSKNWDFKSIWSLYEHVETDGLYETYRLRASK